MKKILKVDLSRYSGSRLPVDIETIIVNLLVICKGNIKKVMHYTNLQEEDITQIYVKYYLQITKIINTKDKTDSVELAIDNGIMIINNQIEEIKVRQSTSKSKILTNTRDLTMLLDRAIQIKKEATSQYDQTINKLNDTIIKQKTVAKLESGEIEDTSETLENVKAVFDQITKTVNPQCKGVVAQDIDTGEIIEFESLSKAGEFFGIDSTYVSKVIRGNSIYKNKYKLIWKDSVA